MPPRSTPMTQLVRAGAAGMGAATIPTADGRREARLQALPQPPAASCAGARTATTPRAGWPGCPGREAPSPDYKVQRSGPRLPRLPAALRRGGDRAPGTRRRLTAGRVVKWLAIALVGWLALSAALFMLSAQIQRGDLAGKVGPQLDPGPFPLTGANTILVLGSDARTEGLAEPGSRRPEPLGLDHAAADRRRRQRLALDPARHRRRHPRPWHGQDQRRVRVRRAGARDRDRQGLPRHRGQPRRRGELRELPAADRRARRRDLQGRLRALGDQRRPPQRRHHAAAQARRDGDQREAGARARPHAQEPLQAERGRPRRGRGASSSSSRR